ncbi:hypothetical protein QPK87_13860 [Kamptonema cortianum]|nr:hypothetical protein [Kamptonema cortianum]
MISTLALIYLAKSVELTPIDDVWVYPHSSDQVGDHYLRCWGSGGQSVADVSRGAASVSWSCLKFDLSGIEGSIKSAKLVLWLPHPRGFTPDQAKEAPIEVRLVSSKFEEETFTFDDAKDVMPGRDVASILGMLSPDLPDDEKSLSISIPLNKDGAMKRLNELAKGDKVFAVALTSKIDPETAGEGGIYKFFSRNGPAPTRPKLILEIDN